MQNISSENWLICGDRPCDWRIPVIVTQSIPMFLKVTPAVPLIPHHEKAYNSVMQDAGLFRDGAWILKRSNLNEIASILPENLSLPDLQRYYSWGVEKVLRPEVEQRELKKMQFISFIHQQAGFGKDVYHAQYLWNQLEKALLEWTAVKRKSIDFNFFTLHVSPYRENWKEILFSCYPLSKSQIWKLAEDSDKKFVEERRVFRELLLSPDLLATGLPKPPHCLRRLEVEYRENWWKAVGKVEVKRLEEMGEWGYGEHFIKTVKLQIYASIRMFQDWTERHKMYSPIVFKGDGDGVFRFGYNQKKRFRLFWKVSKHNKVCSERRPKIAGIKEHLSQQNERVSKVSLVRQKKEDLRDGAGI